MGQERKWLVEFLLLVRYSLDDPQTYHEDSELCYQILQFPVEDWQSIHRPLRR